MVLETGHKLGPYEILVPVGAGGMGEVYKARDTKLGREVAIKVLPEAFAENKERLARFEREARLLASLNHPNIATIHGLEESDGIRFLVMELVDGETLAELIAGGPIPVDEALPLFQQIAEGLEAAHEKGVIHRDLKPANIKVTPEGKVKVLDFGLAKAFTGEEEVASDSSQSPTLTKGTALGAIMGTAAYMSPEQARGKAVDKRTDIWALGCCLYEALTGWKAFEGETVTDTLAAVVKNEPDWSALPSVVPRKIRELLGLSLRKEPTRRLQHVGDARIYLEDAFDLPSEPTALAMKRRPRVASSIILAAVVSGLIVGLAVWSVTRPGPPVSPPFRFAITLPATDQLVNSGIAISADGRNLVYVGMRGGIRQLYRRSMSQLEAAPIRGTQGATYPFFSPDGQWVGFFADDSLKKVSLVGGPPVTLCDAGYRHGASWGRNDVIVFAVREAPVLMKVSASGGAPEPVTAVDDEEGRHSWPDILPGGKAVLYTVISGGLTTARIAVQSLETGERRNLVEGFYPRYAPTGHIIFRREDSLWAVSFDTDRLEVTGSPTPIREDVLVSWRALANFALAGDGSLVYVPGTVATPSRKLVWVDRQGVERPLAVASRAYVDPRLSPDGQRLAVTIEEVSTWNVWVVELARGTLTRLTFDGYNDRPVWSSDGEQIFFGSDRVAVYDIFSRAADGSGSAEQVTTGAHRIPTSVSSDGKTIVFRQGTTSYDIGMVRLKGDREPKMLLETPFDEHTGMLSPDDRWLAYVSNESGREEVYVRPFPGPGGKWQISTEGGTEPMWSRDGRELFYRNGDEMMAVAVSIEPEFVPGQPILLFERGYETGLSAEFPGSNYDVTPDGRFVMIRTDESSGSGQIHVVLNWFDELKRLVPTN